MAFVRMVWRLLVAIKDALVLAFLLLFFLLLYAALSYRPTPGSVREGALLVDLEGVVVEQPQAFDPFSLIVSSRAPIREHRARDVVRAIEGAANDDRIKAIVIDLDYFLGGGQVHLSEIGTALETVRAAGKPVYVHAVFIGNAAMQLAAHADEVWLDPMGGALVAGPGGSHLYYGDLIDRLKLNVHVYRVGTYKSAVEPFERSSMSDEARSAMTALYESVWQVWRDEVGKARPSAELDRVIADPAAAVTASGGGPAHAALDIGLVDGLATREAFGDHVRELVGPDPEERDLPGNFAATDYRSWLAAVPAPRKGRTIGVVTVAGTIVDGEAGPGRAGGETIASILDEAADEDIAALVVRIDSPGGSALAAERIRQALLRFKKRDIPIVVSMANLAASGGYWIATVGDAIVADPATITGSIGVFAVIPSFERTLANWGVHPDGVRTTPLSGQPDLVGGLTPEADALLQAEVESIYDRFLGIVGKSRGMPVAQVETIAEGRVWSGGTAHQLGLVDRSGNFDDAISEAARRAGLEQGDWHAQDLEPEPDFLTALFRSVGRTDEGEPPAGLFGQFAARRHALSAAVEDDIALLFGHSGVLARCLECPAPLRARAPVRADALWLTALARVGGGR